MPFYHECPDCGLNLDPGESCECAKEKAPSGTAIPAESKTNNN